MRVILILVAAVGSIVGPVAARTVVGFATMGQTAGSVSGVVVDGDSGTPVSGAKVSLGRQGRNASAPVIRSATTDGLGAFSIANVTAGSYPLTAEREGYLPSSLGRLTAFPDVSEPLRLGPNEKKAGLVVRMWRAASISGRVLLNSRAPLGGVSVTALRLARTCGVAWLQTGPTLRTDDVGRYSFGALPPGDYEVSVRGPDGNVSGESRFLTTYYSDAASPSDGIEVHLRSGDHFEGADLTVAHGTAKVSGRVLVPEGARTSNQVRVEILPSPGSTFPLWASARTTPDARGNFSFDGIPPGTYIARVIDYPQASKGTIVQFGSAFTWSLGPGEPLPSLPTDPTWWGQTELTVVDHDVSIAIELQRAARMQGRVKLDSSPLAPFPLPPTLAVLAYRRDNATLGSQPAAPVQPDGKFATVGLPPGRYGLVALSPPNPKNPESAFLTHNVTLDGRDVTSTGIDLTSSGVDDVAITITNRPGTIVGHVEITKDLSTFGGQAYAFPSEASQWESCIPSAAIRFGVARLSETGDFRLSGLPPGDYLVAAARGAEFQWIRREFLNSLLPRATGVRLETGTTASVSLRLR